MDRVPQQMRGIQPKPKAALSPSVPALMPWRLSWAFAKQVRELASGQVVSEGRREAQPLKLSSRGRLLMARGKISQTTALLCSARLMCVHACVCTCVCLYGIRKSTGVEQLPGQGVLSAAC